jgi:hypothetical protein
VSTSVRTIGRIDAIYWKLFDVFFDVHVSGLVSAKADLVEKPIQQTAIEQSMAERELDVSPVKIELTGGESRRAD